MKTETMKTKWQADARPDAYGHTTIRPHDGSENGNTDEQPIATVYSDEHAPLIVAAPELAEVLRGILSKAYLTKQNPDDISFNINDLRTQAAAALRKAGVQA